jgi:hypothetical protein
MADRRNELTRAYQAALGKLRSRHDSEFHEILAEVYAERGIEVRKRVSRIESHNRRIAAAKALLEQAGETA